MRKSFLFLALAALIFSACQPDEYPFSKRPKQLLTSITQEDGTTIREFFYKGKKLDSVDFANSYLSSFKIHYDGDQIEWVRYRTSYSNIGMVNFDYQFTYEEDEIRVEANVPLYEGQMYTFLQSYKFNEAGDRILEQLSQDTYVRNGDQSILKDELLVYTWDEAGENILKEDLYVNASGSNKKLVSTREFTYDDKPNPYLGLVKPFLQVFSTRSIIEIPDKSLYLNKNNRLSIAFTRYDTDPFPVQRTEHYAEYEYNDRDFPTSVTWINDAGSRTTSFYTYK